MPHRFKEDHHLAAAVERVPGIFLSFPRHEYFRRILCALIGGWMEAGEIPADFETFGAMVQDISFRNAKNYFAIPGVED
jgi:glucuronate isomerase